MVTMLDLTQHFFHLLPGEVNKNNGAKVHELQYGEYLRQQKAKHKYSIGDHMRKAINKGAFSKSYKFKNFSEKLYEIIDTVLHNPSSRNCAIFVHYVNSSKLHL